MVLGILGENLSKSFCLYIFKEKTLQRGHFAILIELQTTSLKLQSAFRKMCENFLQTCLETCFKKKKKLCFETLNSFPINSMELL